MSFNFSEFKSINTNINIDSSQTVTQAANVDSKQEDETHPDGSGLPHRSGSGVGQFPSFAFGNDAAATTFGASFNTTASLKTSNHFELQFSNQYFHWPNSLDYSNYIPSGPDYTSMNSDSYTNDEGESVSGNKMGYI